MISSADQLHALALGHAQRLGDLRLGNAEQPQRALAVGARSLERGAQRLGFEGLLPHRLQLARRTRQHDDRRSAAEPACAARGRTTSPGAVPTGSSTAAPAGIVACLRLAARIASWSMFGQRFTSGLTISAIRSDERIVEHHLAALESADHLGGQVVRGRAQPPARQDDADPLLGMKRRAASMSRGRSPTIAVYARSTPSSRRRSASQGPLRSLTLPREHLGAGDDYPRSRAHLQVGSWPAASGWRPRALVIE